MAHYHPSFTGAEPSARTGDPGLSADPWSWLAGQLAGLGQASGRAPWPLDPADAADLPRYTEQVVAAARQFAPDRCRSAAQCYQLTQDVRDAVRLMIRYLKQPGRLDTAWVTPWTSGS